jgi:glycosyltransferase involved in cell wall biosynthesis
VVSEYTAGDAADLFPRVDAGRFRVIHHGVDAERFARRRVPGDEAEWRDLESRGLRAPYVFYSGGLSRRKNVRVLAAAFARFRKRHPEFQLVLTGGAKPTTSDPGLRRALYQLPLGSCVRLGTVNSRQLELLYQRAEFFVFPSCYEGFGMPPLEAQAAGCPVICSNATSLPEVVGDSALLFDPRSPRELLGLMERLTAEEERRRLIEAGRRNVARFSWEKTARRWLQLADETYALGSRKGTN